MMVLTLLGVALIHTATGYIGVSQQYNWFAADDYCLFHYNSHLATILSLAEQSDAFSACTTLGSTANCWIGLNDVINYPDHKWQGNESLALSYTNWESTGDPSHSGRSCVYLSVSTGEWIDTYCTNTNYFICNDANTTIKPSSIGYIPYDLPSYSWSRANTHCYYNHQSYLATIKSEEQNSEVTNACRNLGGSKECWIGLSNIKLSSSYVWFNDGTTPTDYYANWYYSQPSLSTYQCGFVPGLGDTSGRYWNDYNCAGSTIEAFVCDPPYSASPPSSLGYIGASTVSYNFFDADDYCLYHYGSHLATIKSFAQHNEASNACIDATQSSYCWIGLNNMDNTVSYVWIDDNSVAANYYENWYWTEPGSSDDECANIAAFNSNYGSYWVADRCTSYKNGLVCNPANTSVAPSSLGYKGHAITYTFFDADDYCLTNHKSHLATIMSESESQEVANICRGLGLDKKCWIGINSFIGETDWIWISNSMVASYINWYPSEPTIDTTGMYCARIDKLGGTYGRYWMDGGCTGTLTAFVCDPENSVTPSSRGYQPHTQTFTCYDAEDYCYLNHQSHLATINTEAQNNEVADLCRGLVGNDECWIGLKSFVATTEYSWFSDSSSKSANYTHWYYDSPTINNFNAYCAKIHNLGDGYGRYWRSQQVSTSSTSTSFICDPPNTADPPSSIEYIAVPLSYTWFAAEDYCLHNYGSHLATIRSDAENNKAVNVCRNMGLDKNCWIGYNKFKGESEWIWSSLSNKTYLNWYSTPSTSITQTYCAYIGYLGSGTGRYWSEYSCDRDLNGFICDPKNTSETPSLKQYIARVGSYSAYDADDYCYLNYKSHLATITSEAENDAVANACRDLGDYACWIGLRKSVGSTERRWMANSSINVDYTKWYIGEPEVTTSDSNCAYIPKDGSDYGRYWIDGICVYTVTAFICNPSNSALAPSSKAYIPLSATYTFFAADDYCYTNYQSHLATINSDAENNKVVDLCRGLGDHECWIGIRRYYQKTQWTWINDTSATITPTYTRWADGYPETSTAASYCGTIDNLGGGNGRYWITRQCTYTRTFICDPSNTAEPPSSNGYIGYSLSVNWFDAEDYCLYHYKSHLATIHTDAQNNEVVNVCRNEGFTKQCWVGLNKIGGESKYTWIRNEMEPNYTKWYTTALTSTTYSHCVMIDSLGAASGRSWSQPRCAVELSAFVCDPPNSAETPSSVGYIPEAIRLTWYDADEHCYSKYQSHLATINTESQNDEAANLCRDLGSYDCWIGFKSLYGETTYSWINNTDLVEYTKWYIDSPDSSATSITSAYCATIQTAGDGKGRYWFDIPCSWTTGNFLCNPRNSAKPPSNYGYRGVSQLLTWKAAESYCQTTFQSSLATVANMEQNNEFVNICRSLGITAECWLGINNIDGIGYSWTEENNNPTNGFTNWYQNEPSSNSYCAYVDNLGSGTGRTWRTTYCEASSYRKYVICNPPPPTSAPTNSPTKSPTNPTLQPTNDPSLEPTPSPTILPSKSPSRRPSMEPTTSNPTNPTLEPTIYPTASPSYSPSTAPSYSPIFNPTSSPTFSPTSAPISFVQQFAEDQVGAIFSDSISVAIFIFFIFLVFLTILAWIHNISDCFPCLLRTDDSKILALLLFALQSWDIISDANFCFRDLLQNRNNGKFTVLFYISVTGLAIPWLLNIMFLIYLSKKWNKSPSLIAYMRSHSFLLLILTTISGANASIGLCNSRIFGLKMFSMDLPSYKYAKISIIPILITCLFEDVPQLFCQIYYVYVGSFTSAALSAIFASTISLIFMLATLAMHSSDSKNDIPCKITLHLTSNDVHHAFNQIGRRKKIAKHIEAATLLNDLITINSVKCGLKEIEFAVSIAIPLSKKLNATQDEEGGKREPGFGGQSINVSMKRIDETKQKFNRVKLCEAFQLAFDLSYQCDVIIEWPDDRKYDDVRQKLKYHQQNNQSGYAQSIQMENI